jgi:hypothetical protein
VKRVEVIASESMQVEIVDALSRAVPGIEYTLIPAAQGAGRRARKEGTPIWPEENFVLFSYLEADAAEAALAAVAKVKTRFPGEGISVFCLG